MVSYLETLEASPHTRATYRHGLDHFAAYLADAGLDPQTSGPERLDVTHLAGFYSWLRRRSPVTRTGVDGAGLEARPERIPRRARRLQPPVAGGLHGGGALVPDRVGHRRSRGPPGPRPHAPPAAPPRAQDGIPPRRSLGVDPAGRRLL